jgi:hypothetical protein
LILSAQKRQTFFLKKRRFLLGLIFLSPFLAFGF